MMRALFVGVVLCVLVGCAPPRIGGVDASGCAECECAQPEQPPDPMPCIRSGIALSGGVQWLLDELQNGDATTIANAADALETKMATYDTCSASLIQEINQ